MRPNSIYVHSKQLLCVQTHRYIQTECGEVIRTSTVFKRTAAIVQKRCELLREYGCVNVILYTLNHPCANTPYEIKNKQFNCEHSMVGVYMCVNANDHTHTLDLQLKKYFEQLAISIERNSSSESQYEPDNSLDSLDFNLTHSSAHLAACQRPKKFDRNSSHFIGKSIDYTVHFISTDKYSVEFTKHHQS